MHWIINLTENYFFEKVFETGNSEKLFWYQDSKWAILVKIPSGVPVYEDIENLLNESVNWENYISVSFQSEWDMIVVTGFLSILKQIEFHLVQNRKKSCRHDHIPSNLKGNGNIVFSVYTEFLTVWRLLSLVM